MRRFVWHTLQGWHISIPRHDTISYNESIVIAAIMRGEVRVLFGFLLLKKPFDALKSHPTFTDEFQGHGEHDEGKAEDVEER